LREDLVDAAGVARENADAQDADAEQEVRIPPHTPDTLALDAAAGGWCVS